MNCKAGKKKKLCLKISLTSTLILGAITTHSFCRPVDVCAADSTALYTTVIMDQNQATKCNPCHPNCCLTPLRGGMSSPTWQSVCKKKKSNNSDAMLCTFFFKNPSRIVAVALLNRHGRCSLKASSANWGEESADTRSHVSGAAAAAVATARGFTSCNACFFPPSSSSSSLPSPLKRTWSAEPERERESWRGKREEELCVFEDAVENWN